MDFEDYINQLGQLDKQEIEVELNNFYSFNSGLFQFFKAVDGQFQSLINSSNLNAKSIETILVQTNQILPELNNLKFEVSMFETEQMSDFYKNDITKTIRYIKEVMVISEVEITKQRFIKLLSDNEIKYNEEKIEKEKRKQAEIEEKKRIEHERQIKIKLDEEKKEKERLEKISKEKEELERIKKEKERKAKEEADRKEHEKLERIRIEEEKKEKQKNEEEKKEKERLSKIKKEKEENERLRKEEERRKITEEEEANERYLDNKKLNLYTLDEWESLGKEKRRNKLINEFKVRTTNFENKNYRVGCIGKKLWFFENYVYGRHSYTSASKISGNGWILPSNEDCYELFALIDEYNELSFYIYRYIFFGIEDIGYRSEDDDWTKSNCFFWTSNKKFLKAYYCCFVKKELKNVIIHEIKESNRGGDCYIRLVNDNLYIS